MRSSLTALCFLLSPVLLAACGSDVRVPEDEIDEGALESGGALTKSFLDGLAAAPGSAERKHAGEILEQQLTKVYPQFSGGGAETVADRELTKKIFGLTVEYLKADASAVCPADKKIRVYRGYGAQLLLHPKANPNRRIHLFGDWNHAISTDLKTKLAEAADPGEVAFENAASFSAAAIDKLDWASLLGKKRMVGRATSETDFIDMQWNALASTHTTASQGSPLLSTALKADVSEGFGPGYIVADLCPERAIPLASTFAFGETEVYVPFFLLPEEIVRVEGFQCGLDIKRGTAKKETCYPQRFEDKDPTNAITKTMTSCYVNFGHRVEYTPFSYGRNAVENRFFDTQTAMYDVLGKSRNVAEVRRNFDALQTKCAPSCATAAEVVTAVKEQLARPATPDETERPELERDFAAYTAAMATACPQIPR